MLARVRARALEAYAHQDLPFEKLVEELAPKRDLSRNPLFQVLVRVAEHTARSVTPGRTAVERLEVRKRQCEVRSELALTEAADCLQGGLEYTTDLFDAATIERMVGHFRMLLEGIVPPRDTHRAAAAAARRTSGGRSGIVECDAVEYPRERCMHALFEEQVARTPRAVAVVMGEAQLTYGELNARANQLAHHLRTLGVGPEVLVGLCLERSLEMVVGLLGILKAGGAYVPLDPGYPAERLGFMLADTQAPVLLTRESLLGALPPREGHMLCIDREWQRLRSSPRPP